MRRLDPQQIREEFNARCQDFEAWGGKTGFTAALEDISRALADLQNNGVDVALDIMGTSSQQAFDLLPEPAITTPISGVLRINHMHHLLSLTVVVNSEPCLKLALSEFDIRFNGMHGTQENGNIRNKVRSTVYDLKNDPEALVKFQKEIIRKSARNHVIAAHDAAQALNTGVAEKKPVLKMRANG